MKRMTGVLVILVSSIFAAGSIGARSAGGSVSGAAEGLFGEGAAIGPVRLETLSVGTGVLMEEDGGAEGVFHAVLQGRSALGQPQQITITGKVDAGSLSPEGVADFRGTALIDLGDGTAPLPGVPFTVAAAAGSLVLGIDSTTLPAAQVTSGVVAIE